MAVIELLTLVGILVRSTSESDIESWQLSNDWNKKTMILCLDGLSIDRHCSFMKKLIKLPLGFTQAFRQSQIFHKALNRVIEISGPLHMAMHMLQSIYTVFEDILTLSQRCVQWKEVKTGKVSDSFRLCESLCFLCYDEIFRYLLLQYLAVHEDDATDMNGDNDDRDDHSTFGISVSRGLYKFISDKAELSTGYIYICNFFKIVTVYKSYKQSCACGDIPAMESLENEFCAVFIMLNKYNYVELVLSQIERRYGKLSYNELQEVRINSAARYKKDGDRTTYAVHVLDDLMENVNMWVKQLPIGDTQDSWYQHSSNVMVARRSIIFENEEYKRGFTDFNKAIENEKFEQYKKMDSKYVEPRKVVERTILFEFNVKYFGIEIPGSKFSIKAAEAVLLNLETSLKKPIAIAKCRNVGLEACIQDINDTCIQFQEEYF